MNQIYPTKKVIYFTCNTLKLLKTINSAPLSVANAVNKPRLADAALIEAA